MPKLNRHLIRTWLADHNWTVARLTAECSATTERGHNDTAHRHEDTLAIWATG